MAHVQVIITFTDEEAREASRIASVQVVTSGSKDDGEVFPELQELFACEIDGAEVAGTSE